MIVTGASLLGQILTNRTSSGLLSARGAVPDKPPPEARPGPAATPAPVTMSLSTLDALFALQASAHGAGAPAPAVAPPPVSDPGAAQTAGRTAVDPDLVRAIAAALDGRKGDGAGLAATGPGATVALETSVSRENSLSEALELAGRGRPPAVDPQGRASVH